MAQYISIAITTLFITYINAEVYPTFAKTLITKDAFFNARIGTILKFINTTQINLFIDKQDQQYISLLEHWVLKSRISRYKT